MTERYQRLYRTQPNYRWWRPLLALLIAALLAISVSVTIYLFAFIAQLVYAELSSTTVSVDDLMVLDVAKPASVALALFSIAAWIPCIFVGLWAAGLKPIGMIHSVAFRLRRNRLARFGIAGLVTVAVAQTLSVTVLFLSGQAPDEILTLDPVVMFVSVLVVLILVPFQAAAEEYAFRGILLQTLGSWLKSPVIPVLVPTVLFMFAHIYDVWGLIEVFLLGLTAGWLTVKTGGLEAAIVIHVVNNVSVFLLLIAGVFGTTVVSVDAGSPISAAMTLLLLGAYSFWVLRENSRFEETPA
jgi:membrane protease YdiL (CAAX protease family)